ncbi:MAG TPA: type II toxin-antitoxin system RelE/ParE family toxin [Beijerinckiaceae bacterium]|nr:type II toxin-antitoxin system RelE/ParE family toxin [Beijerinckiaceae bacterium]
MVSTLRREAFHRRRTVIDARCCRRISPLHVVRLHDILAVLDRSREPDDMNLPGFRLHPLKGELKGHWAVWLSENWRVTFRFEGGDIYDVGYLDYH